MKNTTQFVKNYSKLLVFLIATPLIGISNALAEYKPPSGAPPSTQTVMNGSRSGCGGDMGYIPLTGINPLTHVGQTSKINPQVTVFVPLNQPYRFNVSVYELTNQGGKNLVYENQQIESKTGLMTLPLSSQQQPLKVGSQYVWEVAIACDTNSPLFDQTFVGELKIVSPSSSLANSLANTENPIEKSNLYAQEGYWYDAIAEAVSAESKAQVIKLIDSLAKLESSTQAVNLKEIAQTLETD